MCLLWKNELQHLRIENDCSPCKALYRHLSGEINTIKNISYNDNHYHHHSREHKKEYYVLQTTISA